jgi:hypothetical protein
MIAARRFRRTAAAFFTLGIRFGDDRSQSNDPAKRYVACYSSTSRPLEVP